MCPSARGLLQPLRPPSFWKALSQRSGSLQAALKWAGGAIPEDKQSFGRWAGPQGKEICPDPEGFPVEGLLTVFRPSFY